MTDLPRTRLSRRLQAAARVMKISRRATVNRAVNSDVGDFPNGNARIWLVGYRSHLTALAGGPQNARLQAFLSSRGQRAALFLLPFVSRLQGAHRAQSQEHLLRHGADPSHQRWRSPAQRGVSHAQPGEARTGTRARER